MGESLERNKVWGRLVTGLDIRLITKIAHGVMVGGRFLMKEREKHVREEGVINDGSVFEKKKR